MTTRATVRLILAFVTAYDYWHELNEKCITSEVVTDEMKVSLSAAYMVMTETRKKF